MCGGRNKSQDLSWSYQPLLICAFNPGFMWEPQVVCNNTLPSFVSTQRAFKDNYIVTSFYVCGWRAKSPALWFCCVIQGRSASWFFWAVWWQPSGPSLLGDHSLQLQPLRAPPAIYTTFSLSLHQMVLKTPLNRLRGSPSLLWGRSRRKREAQGLMKVSLQMSAWMHGSRFLSFWC